MLKKLLFGLLLLVSLAAQAAVYSLPWGPKPQFVDANGAPMSSGTVTFYAAGSTTPQNTYTDSTGGVENANPITLNSRGETPNEVWLTGGQSYKMVLKDSSGVTVWTVDNIAGVNDVTSALDEWKPGPTPTFVSGTSFTLAGDQTSTFTIGRRIKTTNSGGTVYSTITNSVFGASTTVTVANDSSSLDSGLSAVSYALLDAANHSVPGFINTGDILVRPSAGVLRGASAPAIPINLSLTPSVSGNALTVAVKGRNGSDPSPSNPVLVPFRNATAATGDYSWLVLTAANSLTISSGSTLGTASSVAFRVWVVAFNDSSTLRLGAIVCATSTASNGAGRDITSLYRLKGWGIASSTAEGGAGGADSALTFYTGSAVTSMPYTVLGYFTWESGLTTAGTWDAAPTRAQLFVPGVPLPGDIIQEQRTDNTSVSTGATTIPLDDTIPQNTEGNEFMTLAITPSSAANGIKVDVQTLAGSSVGTASIIAALFQDSTANALATVGVQHEGAANDYAVLRLNAMKLASTTSTTTFKLRLGPSSAATVTFNGRAGARLFGGVSNSFIQLTEVMQ